MQGKYQMKRAGNKFKIKCRTVVTHSRLPMCKVHPGLESATLWFLIFWFSHFIDSHTFSIFTLFLFSNIFDFKTFSILKLFWFSHFFYFHTFFIFTLFWFSHFFDFHTFSIFTLFWFSQACVLWKWDWSRSVGHTIMWPVGHH